MTDPLLDEAERVASLVGPVPKLVRELLARLQAAEEALEEGLRLYAADIEAHYPVWVRGDNQCNRCRKLSPCPHEVWARAARDAEARP